MCLPTAPSWLAVLSPFLIVISRKTISGFFSFYFSKCITNYFQFSQFHACPVPLLTWKLRPHDAKFNYHLLKTFLTIPANFLIFSQQSFPPIFGLSQYLLYLVLPLFLLYWNTTTWFLKARSLHSPKSACKQLVFRIYLRNKWIKKGLRKTRE